MLDDGTAIGDEAAIASIFANRAKERDALKAVVDAFNDVLPAKHGAEALAALKERFAALVEHDDTSRATRRSTRCRPTSTRGQADDIDQSLRTYADFVNARVQRCAVRAR